MSDTILSQASPIRDEIPVIQAKINPIPQSVAVNEIPKEDIDNQRIYIMGICAFVLIFVLTLVVGFYGLSQ